MELRHVWEIYDVAIQKQPKPIWADYVDNLEIILPKTGTIDTNLSDIITSPPDTVAGLTGCISCETVDGDLKYVDPRDYFKINSSSSGYTYESHPYINTKTLPSPYINEFIEVKHIDVEAVDSNSVKVTVYFLGLLQGYVDAYIKGNNNIDVTTHWELAAHNTGASTDAAGKTTWLEYVGYDEIDIDSSKIVYSVGALPENGGTVTVTVPKLSDNPNYIGPKTLLYNWHYSMDGGKTFTQYANGSASNSFIFSVPASSSGFCVKIIISDMYGYISQNYIGKTIYRVENIPPTTPTFNNLPNRIIIGTEYTIGWTASTDSDGSIYGYVLDKQINGESWETVFVGNQRSTTDVANDGENYVKYRIRAYDDDMTYSEYTTTDALYIEKNDPPIISGTNKNLGRVTSINISYTVSDPGDTVTVTEQLDNTVLKTYRNTEGISHTISLSGTAWNNIEDGTHVLTISARDSFDAITTRSYIFKKSSTADVGDGTRYQIMQKQENGTYKLIRTETDSINVVRIGEQYNVEESLDLFLPESRNSDNPPTDIGIGKIVVGRTAIFAKGNDGKMITLQNAKPPYIASTKAPSDKTILWIDTSTSGNPLLRYWNGARWELLKSVYSGGTKT